MNKILHIATILCAIVCISINTKASGQVKLDPQFANKMEKLTYTTNFKWGFLTPRAGDGTLTVSPYNNGYRSQIIFATSSFFDNFYRMRDTIDCYYDADLKLYMARKHADEDNTLRVDDYSITSRGNLMMAHLKRYTNGKLVLEEDLSANGGMDMVALVMDSRAKSWETAKPGEYFDYNIFSGKSVVVTRLRFEGLETIEVNGTKYRAYKIAIMVRDKAFESGGNKADTFIWLSADQNKVLLKGSMALKVGYAQIRIKRIQGTRYPMTSIIR